MSAATGFWSVNWPTITPKSSSQNRIRSTRPMRNRIHGSMRDWRLAKGPKTLNFQNR